MLEHFMGRDTVPGIFFVLVGASLGVFRGPISRYLAAENSKWRLTSRRGERDVWASQVVVVAVGVFLMATGALLALWFSPLKH